jgi:hypothetical protein
MRRAQRFFGLDPGKVLAIAPIMWRILFRGFGQLAPTVRAPQHAAVELRGCPEVLFDHPDYMRSWTGVFSGALDFTHVEGSVDCTVDARQRKIRYVVVW